MIQTNVGAKLEPETCRPKRPVSTTRRKSPTESNRSPSNIARPASTARSDSIRSKFKRGYWYGASSPPLPPANRTTGTKETSTAAPAP
jgi:hypothetical protein